MRLLLISNSTNAGEAYLQYPLPYIKDFLQNTVKRVLFVPYAGVTFSFDEYERKVNERFSQIGYKIESIHRFADPVKAVYDAECIAIGGGNTWQLLNLLQKNGLLHAIHNRVKGGLPYMGWSAGSNVACPSIRTTNDMPIIQPASFEALQLLNFQINPHYLDANPAGHAGETREDRIMEFIELNPDITVVGLREGTMLRIEDKTIKLLGNRKARIFKKGTNPLEMSIEDNFDFLLNL